MNKFTKSLSIYLLPVLGLIFYFCIDDPVNPDVNLVNISIHDEYGEQYSQLYDDRFFISPGDAPITIFMQSEIFLNTFNSPHDLVITSFSDESIYKYMGITSKDIKPLYYEYYSNSNNFRSFSIRINIPEIKVERTEYFVKYISDLNYVQEMNQHTMRFGDSIMYCHLKIPENMYSYFLSGKIIIFEASNWGHGNKIDYRKFGYKESDFFSENQTIVFTESDLEYDLPDILTNFKNIPPTGRSGSGNDVSISFPGYSKSADLLLIKYGPNNFMFDIPALPFENRIKFTGRYSGGNSPEKAFKYELFDIGENCIITHKEPVSIVSPAYGDSNITGSTIFKINDEQPGGVYVYEFNIYAPYGPLRIYTAKKELKFSEIISRGFEWRPNREYIWFVSKFPGFTDVDDLLSSPYTTSAKYNATQSTEPRYFYTGP